MSKTAWLRWPRLAWAILLSLLLGGVVLVKEHGRRQRAAEAQFLAAANDAWRRLNAEHDRLGALYALHGGNGTGTGWTRRELEQAVPALAGGKVSHWTLPGGNVRQQVAFVDPQTGWHFQFDFELDRWMGYGISKSALGATRPAADAAVAAWLRVRRTLIPAAGVAWLALVLAGATLRDSAPGPHLLHASIMIGVAMFGLAEAHPGDPARSLSSGLVAGGVAVGVSVSLLALARRAAARRLRILAADRVCLACGYDLRATPDRCPECGTCVPPGAAAPAA